LFHTVSANQVLDDKKIAKGFEYNFRAYEVILDVETASRLFTRLLTASRIDVGPIP
jgi:hypothetical protein